MLRSILISLSKMQWAKRLVTHWRFARKMAIRFVAGESLDDALLAVKQLNEAGMLATLDQLGENTTSRDEAIVATQDVLKILEKIEEFHLRANVSVKLSQIGLALDVDLCKSNLRVILEKARQEHNFVRIDMEDSGLTEKTIAVYRWARESGFKNVGIVIQSYLYRSEKDIVSLNEFDTRVRLCKGAYKEPASVAFPKLLEVNESFDRLVDVLLQNSQKWGYPEISANGRVPPTLAVASHDSKRIDNALDVFRIRDININAIEFQMLYGIRRDLQEQLCAQGFPVRIYVPFGTQWYPYFMRRLAERPANLWFFISNFFRK